MVRSGKEHERFMEGVVYANLGKPSGRLRVRPAKGLDNGVVSIGDGRVMIVTTDPVSAIPAVGMRLSAWLSVHLIASDLTTSGADPEFATFSYNFPPAMTKRDRVEYVRSVGAECERLGITIVAGHTGSYPGGGYTVIGSGTMFGFAEEGGYVTPSMAQVGDSIIMTKHAAIEATGSLAFSFPKFVEDKIGSRLAKKARSSLRLCSTVVDARAARRFGLGRGGVTSMHDATEGGVIGALGEMAAASARLFEVMVDRIPVTPEASGVCSAFGLDPLATMAEGALLITCAPTKTEALLRTMSRAGAEAREIGRVREGTGLDLRGRERKGGTRPEKDPYWPAYEDAISRGLR